MNAEQHYYYSDEPQLFVIPHLPKGNLIDARDRFPRHEVIKSPQTLEDHITHFDTNWQQEGLPQEWWNPRGKVGFSMKTQMNLLQDTSPESRVLWAQQTEQDLVAFSLEYLSDHLVYPFEYEIVPAEGKVIDKKYGKDIEEMVSDQERGGVVRRVIGNIRSDILTGDMVPGEIRGYASPLGPTGLKTDDGREITYPDSYWFFMQRVGNKVTGFSIKTDFSLVEAREGIKQLSGVALSAETRLAEYTEVPIRFVPDNEHGVTELSDVVAKLRDIESGNPMRKLYAFKDKTWKSVFSDIAQRDKLYEVSDKTKTVIDEFKSYSNHFGKTPLDLQKALAATFLRISKLFVDEKAHRRQSILPLAHRGEIFTREPLLNFGQILDQIEKISGCAGGGKGENDSLFNRGKKIIDSLTLRVGNTDEEYSFDQEGDCVNCGRHTKVGPCSICEPCDTAIKQQHEQFSFLYEQSRVS